MKVLFLIGDAAVGKMTVGQELSKITKLRLFHNHMTIEPVLEIFGGYHSRVIRRLREVIFEEFASSDQYGLIFTFMWAFDDQEDWDYVEHVKEIFQKRNKNVEFYCAELVAPQEIRLQRNVTENRQKHKPSKRNVAFSNQRLLQDDAGHRMESLEGEVPFARYIKIDNSHLPPEEAARQIKEFFQF